MEDSSMRTLRDIPKLMDLGKKTFEATGYGLFHDLVEAFSSRIEMAINFAYVDLCLKGKEKAESSKDNIPRIEEIVKQLELLDQGTVLPPQSQGFLYCALAILLTLEGINQDPTTQMLQMFRAVDIINSLE